MHNDWFSSQISSENVKCPSIEQFSSFEMAYVFAEHVEEVSDLSCSFASFILNATFHLNDRKAHLYAIVSLSN